MPDRPRRIYVPFELEPEVWERRGKFVKLDGRTYIVRDTQISGTEPIAVSLVESVVADGETAMNIEHWMKRGR
jgi:hypothetical protein